MYENVCQKNCLRQMTTSCSCEPSLTDGSLHSLCVCLCVRVSCWSVQRLCWRCNTVLEFQVLSDFGKVTPSVAIRSNEGNRIETFSNGETVTETSVTKTQNSAPKQ